MPPEATAVLTAQASHPPAAQRGHPRFYVGMSLLMFAIVAAGFGPAIFNTAGRKAPATWPVILHGLIFTSWLVLFLTQALLVSTGRVAVHRRLGYAGVGLALLMVLSGFFTAIALSRRGFDLSGDLDIEADPLALMVFQLGDLFSFSVLVGLAVAYRRRSQVHRRLMLLATAGSLMAAPLTHLLSHFPSIRAVPPAILIPLLLLYSASAIHDRVTRGRIHPVSLWGAIALFVWANLRAVVIGPSQLWRQFAAWLVA